MQEINDNAEYICCQELYDYTKHISVNMNVYYTIQRNDL